MTRLALAALCVALLLGCESSFYSRISASVQDPTMAQPSVGAFKSLAGIPISWAPDSQADGYVVYRRIPLSNDSEQIYRGCDLQFFDALAQPDTLYLYTLAKYRGNKLFDAGPQSVGAWDLTYIADPNGDCHCQQTAVPMSYDTISGHIFYYLAQDAKSSYVSVGINKPDWYYVDLGPRLRFGLQVTYALSNGSAGTTKYLIVSTTQDNSVSDADQVWLTNALLANQRVYFCVKFNPAVASSSQAAVRVDYQLSFIEIVPYNPTNP